MWFTHLSLFFVHRCISWLPIILHSMRHDHTAEVHAFYATLLPGVTYGRWIGPRYPFLITTTVRNGQWVQTPIFRFHHAIIIFSNKWNDTHGHTHTHTAFWSSPPQTSDSPPSDLQQYLISTLHQNGSFQQFLGQATQEIQGSERWQETPLFVGNL